jgi:WD40 repeat protein/serine/threonine protein kinase
MTERTIFLAAIEIADPAARARYLEQSCAGDPTLRQQVESLLASHDREGDFLDSPALEQVAGIRAAENGADHTLAVPHRSAAHEDVAFLSPSTKPGSLGRLGHHEVLEVVGKGGMGIVLRAFDDKLHRVVAIKVLAPHLASNATARQRFVREARATAAVNHDNVIAIHAVDDIGSIPYLVMHFVSGQTLQDKLDRTGPPPLKEVLRIGLQIANGLAAAHKQGLVHRDIKPANILLENGVERVRITDFGLARAADDASLTQSGMIAGTPQYMSPEQAEGKPVDQRTDLFSLGSVLYAMCTGHPPFRAPSTIAVLKRVCEDAPRPPIREANPEIPDWLEAAITRLHAKDPAKRFRTATEVAELLGQRLAQLQQPQPAPLALPTAALAKPPQSGRRRLAATAVLLIAVAVPVGYLMLGSGKSGSVGSPSRTETTSEQTRKPGPLTPQELAKLPSPLDGRKREEIPLGLLALAGGGDPSLAPSELAAVLGEDVIRTVGDIARGLECSPDGKILAVSGNRKVSLYEIDSGKLIRSIETAAEPHRVAFSADMTRLLIVTGQTTADGTAELREIATGNRLQTFTGHRMGVVTGIFGPRDETVVTGGIDCTVRVWETATGKWKYTLPHGGHVHSLAVSPDGKSLITGCNDRALRVWDLETGALSKTFLRHTWAIGSLSFSPNGRLLASSGDREIIVWDAATFDVLQTLPGGGWSRFTDDATLVSSQVGYGDGVQHTVLRWDVKSGKKLAEFPMLGRGGWGHTALTADKKVFFNAPTHVGNVRVLAYDAETGKPLVPGRQHEGPVLALAASPDGKLLASGGADHTVRLWDLETQKLRHVLRNHTLDVTSLAFSPDGKLLASGGTDATIVVWDAARGEEVQTLSGHSRNPSMIAFSPDGRTVAAGADDGRVKRWDVATGKTLEPVRGHSGPVRAVAYSPDGKLLAFGGAEKKVEVVDVPTGRLLHTFALGGGCQNVRFSADVRTLAAAGDSPGDLHLWDLETQKESVFADSGNVLTGLALHPGGGLIAACAAEGTVHFWDRGSGAKKVVSFGPGVGVRQVVFTPEGRYLAAAHNNGTVSILRTPPPPAAVPGTALALPDPVELAKRPHPADALERQNIPPEILPPNPPAGLVGVLGDARLHHRALITALRFVDDDKTLVSVGKDNTVRFWNAASGRQQRQVRIDTANFSGCALSPDGHVLALGYDTPAAPVKLWDLTTEKETRQLDNAADRGVLYPGIAFTPDGKKLVTGGRWYWSKLWDPAAGTEIRRLEHHGCNVYAYAFNSEGTLLASGNEDGVVILWDVASGEQRKKLGQGKSVATVSFSRDGRTLVAGDWHGGAKRWDATTGEELAAFVGHIGAVRAVLLTLDGQTLITGGADKTVRLWDAATGKERLILGRHGDKVLCLALTADGKTLASASEDGVIRLWDVETQKEIRPRQGHLGRVLSIAISPDGKMVATAGEDQTIKLWDLATTKLVRTLSGHTGAVQSAAFHPSGKSLVSQGADGTLRWWDPATGKEVRSADARADTPGVVCSPDGRWFATTGTAGTIVLRDASSGRLVRRLSGHRVGPLRMAFSPNGQLLASAGPDGVRLWDAAGGWQLAECRGPVKGYASVAWGPEGRVLALGTFERTIELRDAWTAEEQGTWPTSADSVSGLAFRADGRLLASLGTDGTVSLLPLEAPRKKTVALVASPSSISAIALTPEGRYLAAANADGTVCVLRLAKPGMLFRPSED